MDKLSLKLRDQSFLEGTIRGEKLEFEIEFHPVGDGERAGDAITARYGQYGVYEVAVVDGGTSESGAKIVEHIKEHYGPETIISHVINTHPDSDHASGLREILKNFQVQNLWMHIPWLHAQAILPYLEDKRWTAAGVEKHIRDAYPIIVEIVDLALSQGTTIYEPFEGNQIGPFTVLSPNLWVYERLLPQFRKLPDADTTALQVDNMYLGGKETELARIFKALIEAAKTWAEETYDIELLRENPKTAAENETSTVLFGQFGDNTCLLTGDAGVNALTWSHNYSASIGKSLTDVNLIQMPHHGSRSNVSPSVLDKIIGPKLPLGSALNKLGVVSVPKDDAKHPRKMVMNAFRRRGVNMFKTCGTELIWRVGLPGRRDEMAAESCGWFEQVEQYD